MLANPFSEPRDVKGVNQFTASCFGCSIKDLLVES